MKPLKLSILDGLFSIHRLKPGADIPKEVTSGPFYSISGSEDELSILAPDSVKIDSDKSEPGWACLKVTTPLEFSDTGILAGISSTLAKAGISIFAVSTFNTDYILVKKTKLEYAREALIAAGHEVSL